MTRLSEALKRAAAETAATPLTTIDAPGPAPAPWQFSPVETMHVPVEPAIRSAEAATEQSDFVTDEPDALPRIELEPARAAAPAGRAAGLPPQLRVGDADRSKLIIGEGVDLALVEQYRQLAAVMHHAQKATGVRSVMVTSALPSEGKTLTATNLALTLSESYQRRVLLVDADLRRPRLREMFALPVGEGLTDSLMTPKRERLPVHQVSPTLWILTAGATVPDPMSLLVSPAMKQLLDDARDAFDWVVVDTPPIAILPDANLLSAMIDTALLVVSAQSTPYPMVQRAVDAIGIKRILGVVLNRADKAVLPGVYGHYGNSPYQTGHPKPASKRHWLGWLRKDGGSASPPGHGHVQ
jgi:protein-tyrosine kinase